MKKGMELQTIVILVAVSLLAIILLYIVIQKVARGILGV